MGQERTYPPLTAYEALTCFFPSHAGHTIMKVRFSPADHLEVMCNCDNGWLAITGMMASVHGWTLRDVKHALRNVHVIK